MVGRAGAVVRSTWRRACTRRSPAVALGLVTAVHPPRRETIARAASLGRVFRRDLSAAGGAAPPRSRSPRRSRPTSVPAAPSTRWSSYVIVPLFALANAGVALGGDALSRALTSPITLGVILGLVVGKALGVSLVSLAGACAPARHAARGHARAATSWRPPALAGIGFTVSLFVAELAFEDEALREEAKVGVLAASALAAALGWALFRLIDARAPEGADAAGAPGPAGRPAHRPPCAGQAGRRAHAGRVRRLLVSRTRAPPSPSWTGCGRTRRPDLRRGVPPPAARGRPPGCPAGRRGGGGGRGPGPVLGDARPADGRDRHAPGAPSWSTTREALGLDVDRFEQRPALPRTRAGGGGRRGQRPAQRRPGTPAFYLDGRLWIRRLGASCDEIGWAKRLQNAGIWTGAPTAY